MTPNNKEDWKPPNSRGVGNPHVFKTHIYIYIYKYIPHGNVDPPPFTPKVSCGISEGQEILGFDKPRKEGAEIYARRGAHHLEEER